MDADAVAGTRAELRAVAQRIGTLADDVARVLASVAQSSGSVAEDLDLRSRRLRQDLSGALVGLVGELRAQARAVGEDQDYTDAVERAYATTRAWITDGLGIGEQAWRDEALRSHDGRPQQQPLRRRRAQPGPGGDQQLLRGDRRLLRRAGAGAVGAGRADPPRATRARCWARSRTRRRATRPCAGSSRCSPSASEPCPRLRRAVEQLLTVRLDYRSQLHPRVRAELDGLTLQERDPVTGEQRNRVVVEVSPDGAEQLYAFVVQMAEQAAYLTKKALLLREGVTPALVLHAAAEQLEDTMIRSGDSEREFKRLARSYRDEIWPGVFGEIDAANARVASVARARDALVATLAGGEGMSPVPADSPDSVDRGPGLPDRAGRPVAGRQDLADHRAAARQPAAAAGHAGVAAALRHGHREADRPAPPRARRVAAGRRVHARARCAAPRSRSRSSCCSTPACAAPGSGWSCSTTRAAGWTRPPARTTATATGRRASGSCSSAACCSCRSTPRC